MLTRFAPRYLSFAGRLRAGDWQLKCYRVQHRPDTASDCRSAHPLLLALLPTPAWTEARPGVGFLIEHCGATADYAVLAWWDNHNELPLRIRVRDHGIGENWRPARDHESICVWDLEVIAFERAAFLDTLLSGDPARATAASYLARICDPPTWRAHDHAPTVLLATAPASLSPSVSVACDSIDSGPRCA